MKTTEYLDAAKEKLGIESDYELAKRLGITRSAVSWYRRKHGTFNTATSTKIAAILNVNPLRVIVDAEQERASDPAMRAHWKQLSQKIAAVLVVAGVGGLLTLTAGVAEARFDINKSTAPSSPSARALYALPALRRWLRRLLELAGGAAAPLFSSP